MTPLVAVATGKLVALGDLALLRHIDPHQLVDTTGQFVVLFAVEDPHVDDHTALAVGHLHRGVAHLAGLLSEDGANEPLLRGQLGLTALGVTLPTRMSPGPTSAPMRTIPRSSRSARTSSGCSGCRG